jgi:crystallin alpha B
VAGGVISVEGKHEEKSEDGRTMMSRQFSRKYSLPAGAKHETVVSNLSSDGVLVISAPKSLALTNGERNISIKEK